MSSKITVVTLAVLLTAVTANAAALARNNKELNAASGQRSNDAFFRPSGDIVYNSQVVGRDPDQNIRWQILRDR
jgi:hypothetical protein